MVDATVGMVLDTTMAARISVLAAVEKTSESTFDGTLVMTGGPVFETKIGHPVGKVDMEAARGMATLKMRGAGVRTMHNMAVGRAVGIAAVRTRHLMIGGAIFKMIQKKIDTVVPQDYL